MKLFLSNADYLRNFEAFLRSFDPAKPSELSIATHKKWINVHPVVLSIVAALAHTVHPSKVTISDVTATSGHYLARMGLFESLGKKSPFKISEHESAGRFIPLTQIRTQKEQTNFITDMIPLLHMNPQQADAIKYMVGELVRNVLEHSRSKYGAFVAAQYYAKTNIVRLGICDTGIGIRQSINQSWPAKTHLKAIKLALTPGITGTTTREGGTEANAGAGLFFIKSMAMVARDYLVIYSGSGLYKLTKRKRTKGLPHLRINPNQDKHSETDKAPIFPGTVVGIDISLEKTNEFTALLAVIREAYTRAVKERRKQHYQQPRFI
ncbi:MAG: hypothetical protein Q7S64_01985 [bacterium]|nr:hypothetical protein [bacterium]